MCASEHSFLIGTWRTASTSSRSISSTPFPLMFVFAFVKKADAQAQHIASIRGTATIAEKRAIEEWVRRKMGESLDESFGACFMRNPRIAQIVADAITFFDGDRYDLFAWSVMPNHV